MCAGVTKSGRWATLSVTDKKSLLHLKEQTACRKHNPELLYMYQVGFGSGFKTNSAVWNALRAFKDTSHEAWVHITAEDIQYMWDELEKMGVSFVDGVMPPYEAKAAKKEPNK